MGLANHKYKPQKKNAKVTLKTLALVGEKPPDRSEGQKSFVGSLGV
jgi:hypothetical protein